MQRLIKALKYPLPVSFLAVILPSLLFFFFLPAIGADFAVSPIRLFFDAKHKTNVLTIKNNSEQKLSLQIRVFSWSQDEEAKDLFFPTEDIILFPRILKIAKDEERIIRVGVKVPPTEVEKTYRIYLEEIPEPQTLPLEETTLRTVMKVGVPLFITPVKTEVKADVEDIGISGGELTLTI